MQAEAHAPLSAPRSVCRFAKPGAASAPDAQGRVQFPPNHPTIAYMGRVACAPEAVTFAYPGGEIRVRFVGTGLELLYEDRGEGGSTSTNYFNVVIDGGEPRLLRLDPKQKVHVLAQQLPPGEHSLQLFKRTESSQGSPGDGVGRFLGFRAAQGVTLLPPVQRAHRIEFIGDSITCGFGADLSVDDPSTHKFTSRNANAYASWAAVTARELDADLMLVAYSGRGAYRNYRSVPGEPMPGLYLRALPDDPSSRWDFSVFQPEVVVVNLGTNDFSPGGVDRARFRDAYAAFLKSLRARNPKAPLIIALGPMLSDSYPEGEQAWSNIQADAAAIQRQRRADGDENVHVLTIDPQSAPFGEDWHPSAAEHRVMARKVTDLIKSLLHW